MKAQVIARQKIIDPVTNKLYDDRRLIELNGIMYGPVHEIDGDENYDDMINEFEELHPDFRLADYKIEFVGN